MSRFPWGRTHPNAASNSNSNNNVEMTVFEYPQCLVCCENRVPPAYACGDCKGSICVSCLTDMFRRACKDESRMPPRCCNAIQLSSALPHLTPEEIELFRSKYEEWSTPHRTYCSVKTCSAFISKIYMEQSWKWGSIIAQKTQGRWYCPSCHKSLTLLDEGVDEKELSEPANDEDSIIAFSLSDGTDGSHICQNHPSDAELLEVVRRRNQKALAAGIPVEDNDTLVDGIPGTFDCAETEKHIWFLRPQSAEGMNAQRRLSCQALFPCSSCKSLLCRLCKQLAHSQFPRCGTPKDQALERHLKRLKIKRCPKCGHGIRWMHGCSDIKCRCGAHFCWFCRSPLEECRRKGCTARGRQEGRFMEHDFLMKYGDPAAMGGMNHRDFDSGWDWGEREMDFGEEPGESEHGNVWGCQHRWAATEESGICHDCFEIVPASASGPMAANPDDVGKDSTAEANDTLHQGGVEGGQAGHARHVFQCVNCRILSCNRCRSKEDVTYVQT